MYRPLRRLCLLCVALVLTTTDAQSRIRSISPSWLPAASTTEPIKVGFSDLPPSTVELFLRGALSVRWNGHMLRPEIIPQWNISSFDVQFTVPANLCTPGLAELVFWDNDAGQPLPYRAWIPVIIPEYSVVLAMEADPDTDRLAAAMPAEGKREGPGGTILFYRLSTGELLSKIPILDSERVVGFSRSAAYAWISEDEKYGKLARLNLVTGERDQRIQVTDGYPPYQLSVQASPSDPRVIFVRAAWSPWVTTRVYRDGSPLPNLAEPAYFPLVFHEDGRVITSAGELCSIHPEVGFINCNPVLSSRPKSIPTALWNNRLLTDHELIDLTTGKALVAAGFAKAAYLPVGNWLLSGGVLYDADTLKAVGSLPNLLATITPQRVLGPDRVLVALGLGIFAGAIPHLGPAPAIAPQQIVNAASNEPGPLAPGQIISIFGRNLGPASGAGPVREPGLTLATEVENTRVLFDGIAGPILYTGPDQINVVVPESTVGPVVDLQVLRYGVPSSRLTLPAVAQSPGLFSYPLNGRKYAAALNADGHLQAPDRSLRRGETTTFFGTGIGLPQNTKAVAVAARPAAVPSAPSMTVGGRPARVSYAGLSPGSTVGLTQINIVVSSDAPVGAAVEVIIDAGGRRQNNIWVAVQ